MADSRIVYLDRPGRPGTDTVIAAVKRRVRDLSIRHVVVATTTGDTAVRMARALRGTRARVVGVTYHAGFSGKGDGLGLKPECRRMLERGGHHVLICSHALSGVERSIGNRFGGVSRVEIIAHTLRLFGCDGIKVAVEVAVMAADAALVPTDKEIISVGGSGRGADAALVLKAAHMNNFFDLEIREIVAKARQRKK
jgi:hypothetical protein